MRAYEVLEVKLCSDSESNGGSSPADRGCGGENARTMVKEGEYAQTSAIIVIMLIMALSIMAAALLGIYISNSIRKPVKEIEGRCRPAGKRQAGRSACYLYVKEMSWGRCRTVYGI